MSPRCHQKQRHRRRRSSRQLSLFPTMLIVLLVLLQSFELHLCRQLMRRSDSAMEVVRPTTTRHVHVPPMDKRSVAEPSVSQPEEIFSAPNDAADMSYDEYPMVVPKRAALLLDRLMVALHHALENEREGHRIGDFYANKNIMQMKPTEYKHANEQSTEDGGNPPANSQTFNMYSDDDPGVTLDYDFKDLNQINRATGETLMAKSFQRRAGGTGGDGDGAATALTTGAGGVGGGRRIAHGANGGGRMYWRCYFNAVSCF